MLRLVAATTMMFVQFSPADAQGLSLLGIHPGMKIKDAQALVQGQNWRCNQTPALIQCATPPGGLSIGLLPETELVSYVSVWFTAGGGPNQVVSNVERQMGVQFRQTQATIPCLPGPPGTIGVPYHASCYSAVRGDVRVTLGNFDGGSTWKVDLLGPERLWTEEFKLKSAKDAAAKPVPSLLTPGAPLPAPKPPEPRKRALKPIELDALRARIQQCWNPPAGQMSGRDLSVRLLIKMNPDGSLAGPPKVLDSPPRNQIVAESALRAVQRCAPYRFMPREAYDEWKTLELNFDPKDLFRG